MFPNRSKHLRLTESARFTGVRLVQLNLYVFKRKLEEGNSLRLLDVCFICGARLSRTAPFEASVPLWLSDGACAEGSLYQVKMIRADPQIYMRVHVLHFQWNQRP